MSDIVEKWILERLGIIIDMTPQNFAQKTANGHLIAQLLKSYDIISIQEINQLKNTDSIESSFHNFKHIAIWLEQINIILNVEDIYEIVHSVGTASLHLFYQIFLELKGQTKLDFATEKQIKSQITTKFGRFRVNRLESREDPNKFDLHRSNLCEPFFTGGDVYHWYKDRMMLLEARCKEARDEYLNNIQNRSFDNTLPESDQNNHTSSKASSDVFLAFEVLPSEDTNSILDRSYEELVKLQEEAKKMTKISPDHEAAKTILKKLKTKDKQKHENRILKHQLEQEILNAFEQKINQSMTQDTNDLVANIFMKQSMYEKELVTKVAQIQMLKEFMIENKIKQTDILNKMKDQEFATDLLLKDNEINERQLNYYLEKERLLDLHRRVYDKIVRKRKEKHEQLCSDTVKDLVEIAMRISENKKAYGRELNRREMVEIKDIFVSSQSVYDICQPVVDIIKNGIIPENILSAETLRQNALDDIEFEHYMTFEYPWELSEVNNDNVESITRGLNVFGYIVARALSTKYPIPPLCDKPKFPDMTIRVCIHGLNDAIVIENLKYLLNEKDIKIIELSEAVNYCIAAYEKEHKTEYDEEPVKETSKTDKLTKKKGKKSKEKKKVEVVAIEEKLMENKMIQTPIVFPYEDILYSPKGLMGKTAKGLLDDGQPLDDNLLIKIFIEYLKSFESINGWVLINYPNDFEQASILEQAFTGVKLINDFTPQSKSLEAIIDPEVEEEKECNLPEEIHRISQLLPNPNKPPEAQVYKTYLTAYIKLKKLLSDDKNADGSLPPTIEELGNEPDPLDKFYSRAGANYSMYYKEFDTATIKYLAKLIIGDYSLPLKSSLELFGEAAKFQTGITKNVKGTKIGDGHAPKNRMILNAERSEKVSTKTVDKKGKPAKIIIVFENKAVQVPTDDEEELVQEVVEEEIVEDALPGNRLWEYHIVECPQDLLLVLANLWENFEEIYINDLKQIFFLKRINMASIMPFVIYVKDTMKKVLNRPDTKGLLLASFQKAFNGFDMDFRKDDEFKAEMHCRIQDFEEKLIEIIDLKMIESENIRCRIIAYNWTPRQLMELFNIFINILQVELDRFIESLRFINDYYTGVFTQLPTDDDNYREEIIPKVHKISTEAINSRFENVEEDSNLTIFNDLLHATTQKILQTVKKLNVNSANLIEKSSKPKTKSKEKPKKTDLANSDNQREENLIKEWQCAISGETNRLNLRLDLIKSTALKCLDEFFNAVKNAFHSIYSDIDSKYRSEMENIKMACNVFRWSVEQEIPIQKEMLFEHDTFKINPDLNLFDNPPIMPDPPILEEDAFTISQLSKITDILLELSPSGYIPRSTFIYILQDILWVIPGDDSKWLSPKLWRQIDCTQLKRFVDAIYDDLEYVYWKDFIVYNIRIKFPTEMELLNTRNALKAHDPDYNEVIENYQFYSTKLWFELSFPEGELTKIQDIKRLLYKMYHIKSRGLHYTALLLDFCKSDNAIEGFAKALELSIGKFVAWQVQVGEVFVKNFFTKMAQHSNDVKLRDEERAAYYKAVYDELVKLSGQVVELVDGVIIEDLSESSSKLSSVATTESSDNKIPENSISNEFIVKLLTDVGTECNNFGNLCFFLEIETVIKVITAAVPWHSRVRNFEELSFREKVADIFEHCKNSEFHQSVLCHEYLNCDEFKQLIGLTKKFLAIDPLRIVLNITNNQ